MAKQFNRKVGKLGEEIAEKYLQEKDFKIIEKNYHSRFGEIDLICLKDKILVFVEVKLKVEEDFGTPEEMINPDKLGRVERMAQFYLIENPDIAQKYSSFSINAVCVVLNKNGEVKRINHYENLTF